MWLFYLSTLKVIPISQSSVYSHYQMLLKALKKIVEYKYMDYWVQTF